ncbi:MAG: L-seryl-tRNA(Sec) selenium transferase, partial [Frankiaceae bacterium]
MEGVARAVPRTDVVLGDPRLVAAESRLGRPAVKDAVRAAQQQAREGALAPDAVVEAAVDLLPAASTQLRAVLNATGVVLHTNLGRAPLSPAAREALVLASGYVDVEYDLDTGTRARRGRGALAALRAAVAGAAPTERDVLIVNNGAAALVLAAT